MKTFLRIGLSLILSSLILDVDAQSCSDRIEQGKRLYNNGQFSEIVTLLDTCKTQVTGNELWNVHRLLALAYLGQQKSVEAKEEVYGMMEVSPEYIPDVLNDPADLIRMINSITIVPKLSFGFGLNFGPSTTFPEATNGYMITDQIKKYSGKNTIQLGLSSCYQFNKTMAMEFSLLATTKSYDLDYSFGNWDLKMTEKLSYLSFPVMFRYIPDLKTRIRPFVQIGGYGGYLVSGDNSFHAKFLKDESSFELTNINSVDRRNRLDYGIGGGAGVFYKLGPGHVFLGMNFLKSMRNITNADKRYDYPDLQQSYHYLDDDIKLNNLAFGIGYNYYIDFRVIREK